MPPAPLYTPPPPPIYPATIPASYYIGCYRDDLERDLKNYMGDITNGDLEACRSRCASYFYFSLQAGVQCFCGNGFSTASKYYKLADGHCQMMNNGRALYWGNGWANAVLNLYNSL